MQLSERALKDQLITLSENKFELPENANYYQRALEMMPHLGSVDSELRDDLIYSCLATWLLAEEAFFTEDELKDLLAIALDEEHLFYEIGKTNSDSVFMRSFSMLTVPLLLIAHRRRPYLTKEELLTIKSKLLSYLQQENDLRGYVDEADKGWAHAVAHSADALDDLAQCKELGADDLRDILAAIRDKIAQPALIYNFEEDERMVIPVIACLSRKTLKEADVVEWLNSFVPLAQELEPFPAKYRQALNVKQFLRSLYFRASKPETAVAIGEVSAQNLADLTKQTLAQISRF